MVRDFTEETKQRLCDEIDDINKKTWSPVTDFLGDLFLYGGKWIGVLSLNDDMSNVTAYQRSVLDMTDMTKKDLKKIFEDVYNIDKEYRDNFEGVFNNENKYNARVEYMASLLKPNFSICSAAEIRKGIKPYNDALKATSKELNETFKKEVDWAAKQAALKSAKGILTGIFKAGVDIVCLPGNMIKNIVTGNYVGLFTDTWDIINDVFAVGGNLVGLAAVGLGYAIGGLTDSTKVIHEAVKSSEAYGGVSGLTEVLEAEEKLNGEGGMTTILRKGSHTIDTVSAGCSLVKDMKDFLDDPSEMMDLNFGFKGYKKVAKVDMLEKYQEDYRKWQALYRRTVKANHAVEIKNLSNLKGFLDPFIDAGWGDSEAQGNVGKAPVEKSNKWFKAIGDGYDFGEDIAEIIGWAS